MGEEIIKSYKGMDKDMRCKGFQYELGKSYETDNAVARERGFHACESPLDVLNYYPPCDGNRYFAVEQSGTLSREGDDSKVASTKLTICAEIGIPGLAKAHVEWVKNRLNKDEVKTNTGDQSVATNTGNRSAATNTGDQSVATNTGYRSAATNTGYRSAATNTKRSNEHRLPKRGNEHRRPKRSDEHWRLWNGGSFWKVERCGSHWRWLKGES